MRLNCGKSPRYRPLGCVEIGLVAIIVDPTAPLYSFQLRRPPTRMRLALPLLQQPSMPRQRLRSILYRESHSTKVGIIRVRNRTRTISSWKALRLRAAACIGLLIKFVRTNEKGWIGTCCSLAAGSCSSSRCARHWEKHTSGATNANRISSPSATARSRPMGSTSASGETSIIDR